MSGLYMTFAGLDALKRGFAQAPEVTRRELLAAATASTIHLEGQVKDRMPDVSGFTRASVHSDAFSTPMGVIGTVGSSMATASFLELGRKPGKGVSREGQEALGEWAKKKLGVSEKEVRNVVFLISRKIKKKGLEAKKPFELTLAANQGQVLRAFENAAGRVAAHLAGQAGGAV